MITERRVVTVLLSWALLSGVAHEARAQTAPSAGAQKISCSADLVKSLAGTWKAPQYRMKRASEVGTLVFGPDALDIRDVELTLEPSGEGVLKISTSVLDQKGKTWAPTLIEAKLTVAAPQAAGQTAAGGRCEPIVTVASVNEHYLDDTNYQTPLPGSRVTIITDPAAKQLEVRFETPKGEGSFWSTLMLQTSRTQPQQSKPRPKRSGAVQ
jgi:hypothetical protein